MSIIEDYVSRETYKLLIEKGFDGEIHTIFDKEGYTQQSITLQTAMKWLRKVHELHIWIDYSSLEFDNKLPYLWNIRETKIEGTYWSGTYHKSCEEATETAIKYCLTNLI